MSHFYADITGNRGTGTRCGTKKSGIGGHIRGWTTGAKVIIDFDEETGEDIVRVYRTSGSSGGTVGLVAEWSTEHYQPFVRECHNVPYHTECDLCVNRFKCFTEQNGVKLTT